MANLNLWSISIFKDDNINLHNNHEKGPISLTLSNSEKSIRWWSKFLLQAVIGGNIPEAEIPKNKITSENM